MGLSGSFWVLPGVGAVPVDRVPVRDEPVVGNGAAELQQQQPEQQQRRRWQQRRPPGARHERRRGEHPRLFGSAVREPEPKLMKKRKKKSPFFSHFISTERTGESYLQQAGFIPPLTRSSIPFSVRTRGFTLHTLKSGKYSEHASRGGNLLQTFIFTQSEPGQNRASSLFSWNLNSAARLRAERSGAGHGAHSGFMSALM